MQEEIIKLYRAESSDGFHFDLEANNKKRSRKKKLKTKVLMLKIGE